MTTATITRIEEGGRKSVIKSGVVDRFTSSGVFVWDPLKDSEGPGRSEWFPYDSPRLKTKLSERKI